MEGQIEPWKRVGRDTHGAEFGKGGYSCGANLEHTVQSKSRVWKVFCCVNIFVLSCGPCEGATGAWDWASERQGEGRTGVMEGWERYLASGDEGYLGGILRYG